MWTVDQYIAGISGAAALATALATFLTVREITKQRKAALKPELISVHQHAYVYVEPPPSSLRYLWAKEGSPERRVVLQHSRYSITLLNVGAGAAKQLRSEWTLDIESMATQINALARQASVAVSVELVQGSSEVRILWPDKVVGTHLIANQMAHDRGHVLPASLDKIGLEVEVPSVFLTLASLQIALGLAGRQQVSRVKDWASLPEASLSLSYVDIDGERHVKKLRLTLVLLGAGHEEVAHHSGELPTFMQFAVKVNEA